MTASPAGHERRYRRLLLAYPGSYRRRHGAEIVTTLLEMAESGHGRPSAAQALHLVACGLRQRFRLPAKRPLAVVAAVLAAIALGALGAAGGTWLGWQTAASVPSGDETRALTAAMAGGTASEVDVFPWKTAMNGPVVGSQIAHRVPYSADRIRATLTSAGWRITTFTESTGGIVTDLSKTPFSTTPARSVQFVATKDGLSLRGDSTTVLDNAEQGIEGRTNQFMDIWAHETVAVRPMTIAGLIVGLLAGWLLTAALAYRVRRVGRALRAAVAALATAAFAAAVFPAFDLYRNLYQLLVYDSSAPNPYIVDSTGDQLPAILVPVCVGVGLVAVAVVVLIAVRGTRGGPDPAASEPVATS